MREVLGRSRRRRISRQVRAGEAAVAGSSRGSIGPSQRRVSPRTLAPSTGGEHSLTDIILPFVSIRSLVVIFLLPSCCYCWPSPAPSASSPQRAASRAEPSPHASPCEGCANLPRHSHKKYFFTRAQFFVSLARKHRTGTRALPPLPPTSPLAHKASSPEVRPPHSSSSSSSYSSLSSSSSSAPPPVARRPESLSWKRPLLTAHSHVSTTTTPPSMTGHTLLRNTFSALHLLLSLHSQLCSFVARSVKLFPSQFCSFKEIFSI